MKRRRSRPLAVLLLTGALLLSAAAIYSQDQSQSRVKEGTLLVSDTSFASVASFAARALRHGNFLNATNRLADYERVQQRNVGDWVVVFNTKNCHVSESAEKCAAATASSATVSVRLAEDQATYRVTSVDGPFTPEEKNRIQEYEEDVSRRSELLEFGTIRLVDGVDEGLQVTTSPIWNGVIPSHETASCHVELFGQHGELIFAGPSVEIEAPTAEDMRSGTIWSFGVPKLRVEDVRDVDIMCT